jgi:glutamine amidotransferase-like uncharacterized protein
MKRRISLSVALTALVLMLFTTLLTGCEMIGLWFGEEEEETTELFEWEDLTGSYVLIYKGEGAAEGGPEAIRAVVEDPAGLNRQGCYIYDLQYLSEALVNADAFVIGGTDDDTSLILDPLTEVAADLKSYLNTGGRYLGICGGAYLASEGTDWNLYETGGEREVDIGLVNFDSYPFKLDTDPMLIKVEWPASTERVIYYQYGPFFYTSDVEGIAGSQILSYYDPEHTKVAAFAAPYGTAGGKLVLCGPHPEGDETWTEEDDGSFILDYTWWESGYETSDLAEELFTVLFS